MCNVHEIPRTPGRNIVGSAVLQSSVQIILVLLGSHQTPGKNIVGMFGPVLQSSVQIILVLLGSHQTPGRNI